MYRRLSPLVKLAFMLSLFAFAVQLSAQCSMCRDSTAGSSLQARATMRKAIPMLGIPAVLLFCGLCGVALYRDRADRQNQ